MSNGSGSKMRSRQPSKKPEVDSDDNTLFRLYLHPLLSVWTHPKFFNNFHDLMDRSLKVQMTLQPSKFEILTNGDFT